MSIKRLGLAWLIALVVIPLLMAAIGHEVLARPPSARVSSAPSTSAGAPKDFAVTVRGDTITLAGTAASPDQKNTIATDAKRIWSNLNVVDNLAVNAPTASPSPTAAGSCTNLQSAINTLTDGALTFESNVGSLTASDEQVLARVADKLNTCPDAHAAINGYADNIGNASLNVPLSEERTQTVAG